MRKMLRLFLLIFVLQPALVNGQNVESVLWKISGNGLKNDSYLFGTYHIGSYRLIDNFPVLKKIMEECEFGIFEKDVNPIGEVEYAEIISPPLDSVFTPDEYALVDSFFTNSPYGSIKPHNDEASLQAMLQTVWMLNASETKDQEMSFDDYISFYFSDSLQKQTFGLDEPVEMANSAKKQNHRLIAEFIVYSIRHKLDGQDLKSEDFNGELYINSLENEMRLADEVSNEVIKEGTLERHPIWLPKIISKINEGSCFIVVGLTHLQYKTGLISLLQSKGYILKPVTLEKSGLRQLMKYV